MGAADANTLLQTKLSITPVPGTSAPTFAIYPIASNDPSSIGDFTVGQLVVTPNGSLYRSNGSAFVEIGGGESGDQYNDNVAVTWGTDADYKVVFDTSLDARFGAGEGWLLGQDTLFNTPAGTLTTLPKLVLATAPGTVNAQNGYNTGGIVISVGDSDATVSGTGGAAGDIVLSAGDTSADGAGATAGAAGDIGLTAGSSTATSGGTASTGGSVALTAGIGGAQAQDGAVTFNGPVTQGRGGRAVGPADRTDGGFGLALLKRVDVTAAGVYTINIPDDGVDYEICDGWVVKTTAAGGGTDSLVIATSTGNVSTVPISALGAAGAVGRATFLDPANTTAASGTAITLTATESDSVNCRAYVKLTAL